ncbi:unnamed protein product [Rhizophagus irregularis]|nr:unnamed protein product [Rhizophagus irregularis]
MKPGGISAVEYVEKGYLIPKVVSDEIRGRSSTSDDSTKKSRKIFSSKSFKALSNTTRETIKSVLKQKSSYKSENKEKENFNLFNRI